MVVELNNERTLDGFGGRRALVSPSRRQSSKYSGRLRTADRELPKFKALASAGLGLGNTYYSELLCEVVCEFAKLRGFFGELLAMGLRFIRRELSTLKLYMQYR